MDEAETTSKHLTAVIFENAAHTHSMFNIKNFPKSYRITTNPTYRFVYQKVWRKTSQLQLSLDKNGSDEKTVVLK